MRRSLVVLGLLAAACGDDDGGSDGGTSSSTTVVDTTTTATTTETTTGQTTEPGTTSGPDDTTSTTGGADSGSTTGDGSSEETVIPPVSFDQVEPIILDRCGCHGSVGAPGQLVLLGGEAYDNIVGVPSSQLPTLNRIEPGSPSMSYLYLKLVDRHEDAGGGGAQMPRGGPFLEDEQIDLVRFWILGGAEQ